MDLFVVTVSLVLELVLRMLTQKYIEVLPGILIIFRVWRFVRIGHGLVASTYEIEEHKTHAAIGHIEKLEEMLKKYVDDKDIPERPEKIME